MPDGVLGHLPDQTRLPIAVTNRIPAYFDDCTIEFNCGNDNMRNCLALNCRRDLWRRGWSGDSASRLWDW